LNGSANQHGHERLRHGIGEKPGILVRAVKVSLQQDLVVVENQKTQDKISSEIFVERVLIPAKDI